MIQNVVGFVWLGLIFLVVAIPTVQYLLAMAKSK